MQKSFPWGYLLKSIRGSGLTSQLLGEKGVLNNSWGKQQTNQKI